MASFEVRRYSISEVAGEGYRGVRTFIRLYGPKNELGYIFILKEGLNPPSNSHDIAYFMESQREGIIDMLRNEGPIQFISEQNTYAYLVTGEEPVGEEESTAWVAMGDNSFPA